MSRSRKGKISLSLIIFQMIRVISSPSRSATGLATLILAMRAPANSNASADGEGGHAIDARRPLRNPVFRHACDSLQRQLDKAPKPLPPRGEGVGDGGPGAERPWLAQHLTR